MYECSLTIFKAFINTDFLTPLVFYMVQMQHFTKQGETPCHLDLLLTENLAIETNFGRDLKVKLVQHLTCTVHCSHYPCNRILGLLKINCDSLGKAFLNLQLTF